MGIRSNLKRKKKMETIEIKHNSFIVRISNNRVDIEDKAKTWKQSFGDQSFEYGYLSFLVSKKDLDNIEKLFQVLFSTRMVFQDSTFLSDIDKAAMECYTRLLEKKAPKISEKEDAVILAEEKVKIEQTPESAEDLEELKGGKDE